MTQRHIVKLAPVLGLALTFAVAPVAPADLIGTNVNIVSEYTGSPYWGAGSWNDLGDFLVGGGTEWSSQVEDVYDFTQGGVVVGSLSYTLDIGADYIEMTTSWVNYAVDDDWSFLSLLPGDFYGYHLTWDSPVNIASASLSVDGNPVNMGDLNLYSGDMEAWVDSYIVDPQSDSRITITADGLDINMQGIAWEYYQAGNQWYTETSMIQLTFIPAPSVLALLGIAGLCSRRRS